MTAIRPDTTTAINLAEMLAGLPVTGDPEEVCVTGVRHDSREVLPGELYIALPGGRFHGAQFASQAVSQGAAAILTDPAGAAQIAGTQVPVLVTDSLRPVMAAVSARVFGSPAESLQLFGVTGTNGKTTTVALLEAALTTAGHRVGTIGTLGFRIGGEPLASGRSTVTTPDSPDLQALLAVMRERDADAVAIEVSSHAMTLARVDAIRFTVTAFLNLGRDHLDFHPSLADYFEAKAALFVPERTRAAVVWIDDEHGRELARRAVGTGLPCATVGTRSEADYHILGYEALRPLGGRVRLVTSSGPVELELGIPGWHNMIDAAMAFAMLESAGIPAAEALAGLRKAQVPGRMHVVDLPEGAPTVIVDFAHTPQAVTATLEALQGFRQVITVIGCGGDRDAAKRPLMGRAAAELSDLVIITDDNPRTEDPAQIRAAVLAGSRGYRAEVMESAERGQAIALALAKGKRDSVVAILGKGHEQGQQIGDRVVAFDDAVVAQAAWRQKEGKMVDEG